MDNSQQTFNIANHSISCNKLNYKQPKLVYLHLNQVIQSGFEMATESNNGPVDS